MDWQTVQLDDLGLHCLLIVRPVCLKTKDHCTVFVIKYCLVAMEIQADFKRKVVNFS